MCVPFGRAFRTNFAHTSLVNVLQSLTPNAPRNPMQNLFVPLRFVSAYKYTSYRERSNEYSFFVCTTHAFVTRCQKMNTHSELIFYSDMTYIYPLTLHYTTQKILHPVSQ